MLIFFFCQSKCITGGLVRLLLRSWGFSDHLSPCSDRRAFRSRHDDHFHGALAPSLFHAVFLLSLTASQDLPIVDVLLHRGGLLIGIQVNIRSFDGLPRVPTAILMLIGYDYCIDGADCQTIAAQSKGLQRALFWQELLSCLMAGMS